MGVKERFLGLLPRKTQPSEFEKQLKSQKSASDVARTAQLREEALEEEQRRAEERQRKQTAKQGIKERRREVDRLGTEATKLFRPKLEALKKVYMGRRGKIVLDKNYDSDYAELALLWDYNVEHRHKEYGGYHDRWGGGWIAHESYDEKVESYKAIFFQLQTDGTVVFGSRNRDDDRDPKIGQGPKIYESTYDKVTFNINDKGWDSNLTGKISETVQHMFNK